MIQFMAPSSCAAQQGNATSGVDHLVLCIPFFAAVECVGLENGAMLPINQLLNCPRIIPCHSILHLRDLIAATCIGSRPKDPVYKPHSWLRGTV
jgi:hypothetical protein